MEGGLLGDGVSAAALWDGGDERGVEVFQTLMEHSAPEGWGWRELMSGMEGGLLGDDVGCCGIVGWW